MVLSNFEDKDDLCFFQELKQSLMPTLSSSPIPFAEHSSLVFSNPSCSIDLPNLRNKEGCFIRVGPSITFIKIKKIFTPIEQLYIQELERIITWVKMGEVEKRWATNIGLVGLLEIDWRTPHHDVLVEFLNSWQK